MTDPNTFTHEDTLAAREIVKGWMTPAFRGAIDDGDLDPWGLMERARQIVIKQRKVEEQQDG